MKSVYIIRTIIYIVDVVADLEIMGKMSPDFGLLSDWAMERLYFIMAHDFLLNVYEGPMCGFEQELPPAFKSEVRAYRTWTDDGS